MQTVLQIEGLKKYYGKGESETKAIDGIDLQVVEGEFLGIMGSSGSGKSTLLNCIATVINPSAGTIELAGQRLDKLRGTKLAQYRGRKIGYLFQNFELIDNLTGRENILLPMSLHNINDSEANAKIDSLIKYLEIEHIVDKFPIQMSGGEKQRVAAARALVMNPDIILADEPTGALDSKNAKSLMVKLEGLNKEKHATILMVTHDSNAASFCSRILFIQDGKIFHELRRDVENESRQDFYERIIKVMAQLGGGIANVL